MSRVHEYTREELLDRRARLVAKLAEHEPGCKGCECHRWTTLEDIRIVDWLLAEDERA